MEEVDTEKKRKDELFFQQFLCDNDMIDIGGSKWADTVPVDIHRVHCYLCRVDACSCCPAKVCCCC